VQRYEKGINQPKIALMKVKELIKIGNVIMKMLHERGITMDYYQHLPMIEEFDIMKDMGHKTTYIIAHLSEKYGICERKAYKIIGKMIKDCTF
jgi:hypothetical protein